MTSIKRNSDGTTSLSFDTPSGSQQVTADHVILALPFAVLRKLDYKGANFSPLKKTAIAELGNGRNSKLQLQFANRLWNGQGSNGASFSDTGYQNTWDVTRGQPGAAGILVNYTGGNVAAALSAGTPYANAANPKVTTLAQKFLKQAEPVFPGIAGRWNGRATLSTPMLDPRLNCSYSYWRVGQYAGFAGWEPARGPDPFRRRALLAGLPGLHGGRRLRGRPRRRRDPRRPEEGLVSAGEDQSIFAITCLICW
jgi:monoamine oxidase